MRNRHQIVVTVYSVDEDGCDVEEDVELPTTWEICETCRGNGTRVNPNIDGNGITSSEWEHDWDDEEREGYFRGDYDVSCSECDGTGKVRVVDDAQLTDEQRTAWEAHCAAESADRSERRYWQRLEAYANGEY